MEHYSSVSAALEDDLLSLSLYEANPDISSWHSVRDHKNAVTMTVIKYNNNNSRSLIFKQTKVFNDPPNFRYIEIPISYGIQIRNKMVEFLAKHEWTQDDDMTLGCLDNGLIAKFGGQNNGGTGSLAISFYEGENVVKEVELMNPESWLDAIEKVITT